MKGLTDRQREILEFIVSYVSQHGYPPSYQEIANAFGIASKQGVVRHLEALERKGYIEKAGATARSIRLIHPAFQPPSEVISLPVIGRVAAGFPILAEENVEEYVSVPRSFIRQEGRYFALRVHGDSMVNAGILDGDLVIVRSSKQANPGNIVVALLGDEVTVKRLIVKNGQRYLKAENPAYPDIHPQWDWQIQGVVVGLLRDTIH